LFQISFPWWEFVARALLVYFFLLVVLRLTGRRQVGQLSPFDFIMLLILSNAVQNSMNGGDNSVTGGLILAATLIAINWLMGYIAYKKRWFAKWVDGSPQILIHNGFINRRAIRKELLTHDELMAILRRNGVEKVEDVRFAIIEPNGSISVIKHEPG
jgi:uncharacterized membrane protein YcaP (DUF421 family)